MRIKNLKLVTLSIVAAFAVNNASYTAARELPNLFSLPVQDSSRISKSGLELSKKEGNNDSGNSVFCDLLETDNELDESELDFNYIMGLYLEFGRGNITIEKARDVANRKVELLKLRVKESQEKQQEKNDKKGYQGVGKKEILEAVLLKEWSRIKQRISEDIDMLNKNGKEEITIQKLQNEYKESAIKWFSGQYGVGIKYKKQVKK
jgi:hypothetical protein